MAVKELLRLLLMKFSPLLQVYIYTSYRTLRCQGTRAGTMVKMVRSAHQPLPPVPGQQAISKRVPSVGFAATLTHSASAILVPSLAEQILRRAITLPRLIWTV